MAKSVQALLVLLLCGFQFACGNNDPAQDAITSKRTARGASAILQNSAAAAGIPVSPSENKVWGQIIGEPQETFNQMAQGLAMATVAPSEMGFISGRSGTNTGVKFWGSVELANGAPLTTANAGSVSILPNLSQLRIVIWDQLAGTTDLNGNRVPEIPVAFARAVSGQVSGNTATLVFQDRYGQVTMQGQFNTSVFQGQISYQNFTSYSASIPARSGILGTFSVSTCGFFRCQ